MGLTHINLLSLLLLFFIILILFGSKRLSNIGADLGAAIKSFRAGLESTDESNKSERGEREKDDTKLPKE